MGIGDRAYMRTPPAAREPLSATVWTLGVLVVFFIAELIQESAGAHFLKSFELTEAQPRIWQWLTHALLHDGFWHLLLSGVLAGASIWWLTGLGGARAGSSLIGISAGVYALMLVALLDKLEHQITVLLFFFLPVTLKVRWVLGVTALLTAIGWIFSELPFRHVWSGWTPAWQDAIAHSAHLGGLIFGWFAWRRLN
ncbi:MAG: rhomboid family intramembrane serine protease, partial [Verrucomicrobia bacterium]|nr:rhomboid family intramembrane serine protease [Verrucomicrobiota bacterium]